MSITSRRLLLFFSALAHVSGALGGLKWGIHRENEHRVYMTTKRDPCNPGIYCPADDTLWLSIGERPQAALTGAQLCELARKSFNEIHASLHGDCPNPVAAECTALKCTLVMDTSSPTSLCRGRNSKRRKSFSECAKEIKKEHEKFMANENKFLEERHFAKPRTPCTCPHCRGCPMAIYGCPYCPVNPRKVESLEMERPEEEYAGIRDIVGSLNVPALVGRRKSTRTYEPPLSMATLLSNVPSTSSSNPYIPALSYQTPNPRPIMTNKGERIGYSRSQAKYRPNNYASSSKP